MLPFRRKYGYKWSAVQKCVDAMDETTRYRGLIELNVYEVGMTENVKIYFDDIRVYPRTLYVRFSELQCTDIQYIRPGTRVEFNVEIDRERRAIVGVRNITAPNGRLLTFLDRQRGEFYRWRNINCKERLPSILTEKGYGIEEEGTQKPLVGFIRDLDFKGHCGVIEIVSRFARYERVFFWFRDVLFERANRRSLRVSSVVEFQVTANYQCYRYSMAGANVQIGQEQGDAESSWTKDPRSSLMAKAIEIVSYQHDRYLSDPPWFDMSHVDAYVSEIQAQATQNAV